MRSLLALALVVLAAPDAARALSLLDGSQDRSVSVYGESREDFGSPEFISDSDDASAPGFGAFVADVEVVIAREGSTPLATATQDSAIGATSAAAAGSVSGRTGGGGGDFTGFDGRASSIFSITFDVDVETTFSIDLFLSASPVFESSPEVGLRLEQGGVDLLQDMRGVPVTCGLDTFACGDTEIDGVLAPGEYTLVLEAEVFAVGGEGSGEASYDLLFTVPEPGRLALLGLALLAGVARSTRRR